MMLKALTHLSLLYHCSLTSLFEAVVQIPWALPYGTVYLSIFGILAL